MEYNTTLASLCQSVFTKIKDYDLCALEEEEAIDIIADAFPPARLMFEDCVQDLYDYNDDLNEFNFTLDRKTFEILSNYMVVEYLDSTYIRTPMALKAHLSSADFHAYASKDVLAKAIEVRKMYMEENNQYAINYGYKQSNLFDLLKKRK